MLHYKNVKRKPLQNIFILLFILATLSQPTLAALPPVSNEFTKLTEDTGSIRLNKTMLRRLHFSPILSEAGDNQDCEKNIQEATCLSNSTDIAFDPDCTKEGVTKELIDSLTKVKNDLPPFHQKVFCHLNRIQIQENLPSIGFATYIYDENYTPTGAMIGFRKSVLEGTGTQTNLWTWKEQLNFGLSKLNDKSLQVSPMGPRISQKLEGVASPDLLYVAIHELSHVIDFMNQVTEYDSVNSGLQHNPIYTITLPPNSFLALDWFPETFELNRQNNYRSPVIWKSKLPILAKRCYYTCNPESTTSPALIPNFYSDLTHSGFFTSYSTSTFMEDFADSSTIWSLMRFEYQFEYKVFGPFGGELFDAQKAFNASQNQKKREWLDAFYARPDLVFTLGKKP